MKEIDLLELRREIFHILAGIGFLIIALFIPNAQYILFIILILGALLSFLATHYKIPVIHDFLCLFERDCNRNFPGKGVLFFFIGSLLSLRLFNYQVALASIIILTFADPVSHFVGSNFGKTRSKFDRRKKVEGTISGILVGTIVASLFVNPLIAFVGSLFAMIAELIGVIIGNLNIDDNLLIPLVSGTIMHLLSSF